VACEQPDLDGGRYARCCEVAVGDGKGVERNDLDVVSFAPQPEYLGQQRRAVAAGRRWQGTDDEDFHE
jgi:hypothetical protein